MAAALNGKVRVEGDLESLVSHLPYRHVVQDAIATSPPSSRTRAALRVCGLAARSDYDPIRKQVARLKPKARQITEARDAAVPQHGLAGSPPDLLPVSAEDGAGPR